MAGNLLRADWQNTVKDELSKHAQGLYETAQRGLQIVQDVPRPDPNEVLQQLQSHVEQVAQPVQDVVQFGQQQAQQVQQQLQDYATGLTQMPQPQQPVTVAGAEPFVQREQDVAPIAGAPAVAGGSLQDYIPGNRESFIRAMTPLARQYEQQTGLPAEYFLAVNGSESNWGNAPGNMLFGIKARPGRAQTGPVGTWEAGQGAVQASFSAYGTPNEAYGDFVDLISSGRYGPAWQQFQRDRDPDALFANLNRAGYATDPEWGSKISSIAKRIGPSVTETAPTAQAGLERAGAAIGGANRDISQFGDAQLTNAEAYAACGPAAAVRFAQRVGRNPSLKEALDLAKEVGWTQQQGMAGIASQQRLMERLGVPTKLVGADVQAMAREAQSGNPVTISTEGHYFYADGYDPASGAFHVGRSGTDLRGGKEWMTQAEMEARMGRVQGALLADSPLVPSKSAAAVGGDQRPAARAPLYADGTDQQAASVGTPFQIVGDVVDRGRRAVQQVVADLQEQPTDQAVSPVPAPGFGYDPSNIRSVEPPPDLPRRQDVRDLGIPPQPTIFERAGEQIGRAVQELPESGLADQLLRSGRTRAEQAEYGVRQQEELERMLAESRTRQDQPITAGDVAGAAIEGAKSLLPFGPGREAPGPQNVVPPEQMAETRERINQGIEHHPAFQDWPVPVAAGVGIMATQMLLDPMTYQSWGPLLRAGGKVGDVVTATTGKAWLGKLSASAVTNGLQNALYEAQRPDADPLEVGKQFALGAGFGSGLEFGVPALVKAGRAIMERAPALEPLLRARQPAEAEAGFAMGLPTGGKRVPSSVVPLSPERMQAFHPGLRPVASGEATLYHGGIAGDLAGDRPTFLTSDRDAAQWYATERGGEDGRVREVAERPSNPALIDELQDAARAVGVTAEDIRRYSQYGGENPLDLTYIPSVRRELERRGFDSVVAWDAITNREVPVVIVWRRPDIPTVSRVAEVPAVPEVAAPPPPGGFRAPEVEPSTRMYHGTGAAFETPEAGRFDPNGLYGPGYYVTSSPDVAGGAVSRGRFGVNPETGSTSTYNPETGKFDTYMTGVGELASPGYAQARTNLTLDDVRTVVQRTLADMERGGGYFQRSTRDDVRGLLAKIDDPGYPGYEMSTGYTPARVADTELSSILSRDVPTPESYLKKLAPEVYGTGGNVRAVDVPQSLRLLDVDAPGDAVQRISDLLEPQTAKVFIRNLSTSSNDVYSALRQANPGPDRGGWSSEQVGTWTTDVLRRAGYDGISYAGGKRIPMRDEFGTPIEHQAAVIFPESLPKIRNAISGRQGGQATAPFSLNVGGAAAGGYAGSAATPEDAPLEERLRNIGIGATAGLLGTRAITSRLRPPQLAPARAVEGFRAPGAPVAREAAEGVLQARAREPGPTPPRPPRGRGPRPTAEPGLTPRPPGAPEPERAGNILLPKFVNDDARQIIEEAWRANPTRFEEARRGVVSDEEVRELAETVGQNVGRITSLWKPGQAKNAETVHALRSALADRALVVQDTQALAQKTPHSLDARNAFITALAQHAAVQEVVSGITGEAGRALRVLREPIKGEQKALALLDRLAKANKTTPEEFAEVLLNKDLTNPEDVARAARAISDFTVRDKLESLWYFALLSNPMTHIRNTVSNALVLGTRPIESLAASAIDLPRTVLTPGGKRERFMGETPAVLFGYGAAFPEGLREAYRTMRTGVTSAQLANPELATKAEPFSGRLADLTVNVPGRALQASDALFRNMHQQGSMYQLAYRQASQEGARGKDLIDRIAHLVGNPDKKMLQAATDEGAYRVFQQKGDFVNMAGMLREKVPALKFPLPFVQTPYNVGKYALERTPLALSKIATDPKGGGELSDRLARASVGTATMYFFYDKVVQGNITGEVPRDPTERDAFYRQGKQPYSIKVGDTWHSYQSLQPLTTLLGGVVAFHEAQEAAGEEGADVPLAMMTGGFAFGRALLDQPWLQGTQELIDLMSGADVRNPDDILDRVSQYMQRTATSPIPSIVRGLARAQDTTVRKPERGLAGIPQALAASIPGLQENAPAALTAFGEERQRPQGGLPSLFDPRNPSAATDDPLELELARLERLKYNVQPGLVGRRITAFKTPVELTEAEQRRYQRLTGAVSQQLLNAIVASPSYEALPDSQKVEVIEKVIENVRATVRQSMEPQMARRAVEEQVEQLQTRREAEQRERERELAGATP